MLYFIDIALIVLLTIIIVEDYTSRKIHLYLLPILLIIYVGKGLMMIPFSDMIFYSMFNLFFVILLLSVIQIYQWIKKRKFVFIVDTYVGLGDILFFLILCPSCSFLNFAMILWSFTTFMIVFYLIKNAFSKKSTHVTPWAVFVALGHICLIVYTHITDYDVYSDDKIMQIFN